MSKRRERITVATTVELDVDSIAYALRDDPTAAVAFVKRLMREVADFGFAIQVRDAADEEVKGHVAREREMDRARQQWKGGPGSSSAASARGGADPHSRKGRKR